MDPIAVMEAIDAEMKAKDVTIEHCVREIAVEQTDVPATVKAIKDFFFLKRTHELYPEFASDSEEAASLARVGAKFAAALNRG